MPRARVLSLPGKFSAKFRQLGLVGFVRLIRLNVVYRVHRLADWSFDLRYGTDTSRPVHGPELEAKSVNLMEGTSYFPTPITTFRNILSKVDFDVSQYSFVEFGAGKGRVALMAAMRPFKAVVGIEYSAILHAIAEKNLERMRKTGRVLAPTDFICIDAADYTVPPGPCLYYLFNPFGGSVSDRVVENINGSEKDDRDVIIWCYSRNCSVNERILRTLVKSDFFPALSLDVRDQGGEVRFVHVWMRNSEPGIQLATRLCTVRSELRRQSAN